MSVLVQRRARRGRALSPADRRHLLLNLALESGQRGREMIKTRL
jgi:hypothetical protein